MSPRKFVYIYYMTNNRKSIHIFWDSLYFNKNSKSVIKNLNLLKIFHITVFVVPIRPYICQQYMIQPRRCHLQNSFYSMWPAQLRMRRDHMCGTVRVQEKRSRCLWCLLHEAQLVGENPAQWKQPST